MVTFASSSGHILQPYGCSIWPEARGLGHHMVGLRPHGEVIDIAMLPPSLCRGIALDRLGWDVRPLLTTESPDEHPHHLQRKVGGHLDHV